MSVTVERKVPARAREKSIWQRMRKNWAAYLFISPFFILFSIFGLFGLLFSFYVSFQRWDGLTPMRWWGAGNYAELFRDEIFFTSIKNTFILLLFDYPLKILTPLLLAMAVNSRLVKFRGAFRTGFYLPEVTSAVVVAIIFSYLFSRDTGIVNYVLSLVGLPHLGWLQDRFWAKVGFVILSGWWSQGYHMVIFLAGLQSIPVELVEAAIVDGANRLQIFLNITLPFLKPIIIFSAIIATNAGLQRFSEPFLLTSGGPAYATTTILFYLYRKAFVGFRLGYASAMGYVLFVMIFILSLIQLRFGGRAVE